MTNKTTFCELFRENNYLVEIPIIQRDYAQGRTTTSEIRELFLEVLYSHLEKNANIDLDFVYGSLIGEDVIKFIPLDGQQRLTTLFLLHWYLANKENRQGSFRDIMVYEGKSKFTYQTRTTSREFCDALVTHNIEVIRLEKPDGEIDNSFSKTIKNEPWFFYSWNNDPTIKSMLTMLDAIHEKFRNSCGFFDKLIRKRDPVITFQFLNLNEFKLTDDLYIKMNARGIALSPFENFKAKYEEVIKKTDFGDIPAYKLEFDGVEKQAKVHDYFSFKIDTSWANLFWKYQINNLFDDQLMNFIRVVSTNNYALQKYDKEYLSILLTGKKDPYDRKAKPRQITFSLYNQIGCFNNMSILDLIDTLDLVTNGNDKIKQYLPDTFYYDENMIFEKVINDDINKPQIEYRERLRLFAFYQYILLNKSNKGIDEWMRIIHNLTQYSDYNRMDEYVASIRSIHKLLRESSKILSFLADYKNEIKGFNLQQIQEERIKALLIQKDSHWRRAVLDIEKHGYFRGQIEFILKFSGIYDYYKKHNYDLNWTVIENQQYLNTFNDYSKKAAEVFGDKGLKNYKDFVWERALLTKGNYLIKNNNTRYFLNDSDRDYSWKRLLRGSEKNEKNLETKRRFIKEIFDDNDFLVSDVERSLNRIIEKSKIIDWKKPLIEQKELIEYCTKRQIRWQEDGHYIMLLHSIRMSGRHKEMYTYAFFLKYIQHNKFLPFTKIWYYEVCGDEDNPCVVIDEWHYNGSIYAINIFYDTKQNKYRLRLFSTNRKTFSQQIENILIPHGFILSGESFICYLDESYIMDKLKFLCQSFQKL
jgi:hypothetical protein